MSRWKDGNEIATIAAGSLTNDFADNEFELVTPSGGVREVTFFIKRVIDTESDLLMRVGFRLVAGGDIYWATYASGSFTISALQYTIPNALGAVIPIEVGLNQRVAELVVQFKSTTPGGSPGSVETIFAFNTSRGY